MDFISLFLIAVGLGMDAFAVSLSTGMCMTQVRWCHQVRIGLYFGGFQMVMPLIGWLLGRTVSSAVQQFDHWIAFALLALIGGKMLVEAIRAQKQEEECDIRPMAHRRLFVLGIATSIDALAVGVTFAFVDTPILPAAALIGVVTFVLSAGGCALGRKLGGWFQKYAEIVGGVVLIGIGTRILIEHLFF